MAYRTKMTDKKLKVLDELLALGWSENKIASTLGVSRTTVRYHKSRKGHEEKFKNPFSKTAKDYQNKG